MIKRATATRYIEVVCNAANTVNAGDYAYTVVSIEVFGSYLTDKALLGDLDLMVMLRPRYEGEKAQDDILKQRRDMADQAGRTFRTSIDYMFWPTEEVHRILRSSFSAISIHDASFEREALLNLGAQFVQVWPAGDA